MPRPAYADVQLEVDPKTPVAQRERVKEREDDETPFRILVLGDSLSAGYGIALDQAWPSLLGERLAREGYPHRVVNASISGETTVGGGRSGGLERIRRQRRSLSGQVRQRRDFGGRADQFPPGLPLLGRHLCPARGILQKLLLLLRCQAREFGE